MRRADRVGLLLCNLIAVLAATGPSLAQPGPQGAPAKLVHWTVDERLYHGAVLLAPRFVCNTHLSTVAPKDRVGGSCALVKLGCDIEIKAACARLAPYKPDFHNLERAERETSLFDISTYTALHSPAPPTSPLIGGPKRAVAHGPDVRIERKVYGGTPLQ